MHALHMLTTVLSEHQCEVHMHRHSARSFRVPSAWWGRLSWLRSAAIMCIDVALSFT